MFRVEREDFLDADDGDEADLKIGNREAMDVKAGILSRLD